VVQPDFITLLKPGQNGQAVITSLHSVTGQLLPPQGCTAMSTLSGSSNNFYFPAIRIPLDLCLAVVVLSCYNGGLHLSFQSSLQLCHLCLQHLDLLHQGYIAGFEPLLYVSRNVTRGMWVSMSPSVCWRCVFLLLYSQSSSCVCQRPSWQASIDGRSWDDWFFHIANTPAARSCNSRYVATTLTSTP
jgi:hypothetical protein